MLGESLQQRIDRGSLNSVRRRPIEPLKRGMFGQNRSDCCLDFAQKENQVLLKDLTWMSFTVFDGITEVESKLRIDLDISCHDPSFLLCFSQRCLEVCFVAIAMSLGKIPTFFVTHQQKLARLGAGNQQDSSSVFLGQRVGFI